MSQMSSSISRDIDDDVADIDNDVPDIDFGVPDVVIDIRELMIDIAGPNNDFAHIADSSLTIDSHAADPTHDSSAMPVLVGDLSVLVATLDRDDLGP